MASSRDFPWRTQPPAGTGIDWSNPLAAGLGFAYLPGTPFALVSRSVPSAVAGVVTGARVGPAGRTAAWAGSSSYQFANSGSLKPANVTVLAYGRSAGTQGSSAILAAMPYSGSIPLSFGLVVNYVGTLGQNNVQFEIRNTGNLYALSANFSPVLTTPFVAVGTYDQAHLRLYQGGKQVASSAQTVAIQYGSTPPVFVSGYSPSSVTGAWNGDIYLAAIWSRALTAQEVNQVSTNPWQLFAPARRRFYQVSVPTITIAPTTVPSGIVGFQYSQQFTASGGTSPYTYSVTSGSLPPGLTLSSSGLLSGTPTAAGSYSFTVKAADANSNTGTQSYTMTAARYTSPPGLVYVILSNVKPGSDFVDGNLLEISGNSTGSAEVPAGVGLNSDGTLVFGPSYTGGAVWARVYDQATEQWSAWFWRPVPMGTPPLPMTWA